MPAISGQSATSRMWWWTTPQLTIRRKSLPLSPTVECTTYATLNLGMVGNFNRALELARGEYITTWSDDDLFHPDLIKAQRPDL